MSTPVRLARVVDEPLSVDRVLAAVTDPSVGGVGIFVGVVRDHDEGQEVVGLDYTEHPSATTRLRETAEQVAGRHDVIAVAVEHRTGHLEVGDLAVVVAVGAVHRAEALVACHELIDEIKQRVPIWKEQHLGAGGTQWVGLT